AVDDASVLVEDALAAADGAVRADAVGDAVRLRGARRRAAGPRGRDGGAASRRIRPAKLPDHRPVEERLSSHVPDAISGFGPKGAVREVPARLGRADPRPTDRQGNADPSAGRRGPAGG